MTGRVGCEGRERRRERRDAFDRNVSPEPDCACNEKVESAPAGTPVGCSFGSAKGSPAPSCRLSICSDLLASVLCADIDRAAASTPAAAVGCGTAFLFGEPNSIP